MLFDRRRVIKSNLEVCAARQKLPKHTLLEQEMTRQGGSVSGAEWMNIGTVDYGYKLVLSP